MIFAGPITSRQTGEATDHAQDLNPAEGVGGGRSANEQYNTSCYKFPKNKRGFMLTYTHLYANTLSSKFNPILPLTGHITLIEGVA